MQTADLILPDDEEEDDTNHYCCPECDHAWQDVWSCGCDDDCPSCGMRAIEPYYRGDDDTEADKHLTALRASRVAERAEG